MTDVLNQRVLLASRPEGLPRPENFRIVQEPVPVPAEGQLLLQILYLSLDPYMRGRMDACQDGIDVYFENVGGKVWDAVFPLLNDFARVPVCGLISQYNAVPQAAPGDDRLALVMRDVLKKSLSIRGFIQREFAALRPAFLQEAGQWMAQGRLRYRENIVDGLEAAPAAFIDLLQGRNFGKLVVRLAP